MKMLFIKVGTHTNAGLMALDKQISQFVSAHPSEKSKKGEASGTPTSAETVE